MAREKGWSGRGGGRGGGDVRVRNEALDGEMDVMKIAMGDWGSAV
jgi:hypothetical protein